MPVIGINLKEIKATNSGKEIVGIKVNNKANTVDVKEKDFPGIGQKGLIIDFEFETLYDSDNGEIAKFNINGEVLYVGDDCKEILKTWKKEKNIPEDIHVDIINTIFRKCVSKAIMLAEDLQLAPPIGLPFAQKKKKE